MPVVIIKASPKWALPTDVEPEADPIDPEGPYSAEQQLTYIIGTMLPRIVAYAVNMIKGDGACDHNKVLVDFQSMHARAINAPDIWIVVTPMWRDHFEEKARTLRDLIATELTAALQRRLSTIPNPEFDVEIDFMNGAGCSVNKDGETVASW